LSWFKFEVWILKTERFDFSVMEIEVLVTVGHERKNDHTFVLQNVENLNWRMSLPTALPTSRATVSGPVSARLQVVETDELRPSSNPATALRHTPATLFCEYAGERWQHSELMSLD
jgi:hypothetical protein